MLKFSTLSRSSGFATLSLLSVLIATPACAADAPPAEGKSSITVNGVVISQERMDMHVKAAAAQGRADSPQLRMAIQDELISLELMAQEAVKNGLDQQAATKRQIEAARQSALVGAFVQDHFAKNPITEEEVKKEYETLKSATSEKEYKARHILVKEEKDAQAIVARLKKGAKFELIAKRRSLDTGSAVNGGDLGWSMPSNFVPPFATALKELKKGQVSAPVQSEFGWHIIKLDAVREFKFPAFEEVRKNITQRLQQQSVQKAIGNLRAVAKIE